MTPLLFFAALVGLVAAGKDSGRLEGFCRTKPRVELLLSPPPRVEVELGGVLSVACAATTHGGAEPFVYWTKGHGARDKLRGRNIGPVASTKSVLYFDNVTSADVDSYRCVVEACCPKSVQETPLEVAVPDKTCKNAYGLGNVLFWTTWEMSTWKDAKAKCESRGLIMAMPMNAAENAQLLKDIQTSFLTHPSARKFAAENWIWIGATDEAKEGDWREASTGAKLTYLNWQSGQPDDWKKLSDEGQDVMGISRLTGRWDDSFNTHERPYVCRCPRSPGWIKKNVPGAVAGRK